MDGGELERWAADALAQEAAGARVRERWLRAQAEEEASLWGVLRALAERREAVALVTASGGRHLGVVTGVGEDFVALQAPGGTIILVALAALGEVRVAGGSPSGRPAPASAGGPGADRATLGARLVDVLAQAAGQRPRILLHTGSASVVGDLRAIGRDVLTVRTDGAGGAVYVALASLSAVSFLASG